MRIRHEKSGEGKYEERWSQIEAKLKEYKELISSINKAPSRTPEPSRRRSISRPARVMGIARAPAGSKRATSKDPMPRARGTSIARRQSPLLKPQPTLSVSGVSCMRQCNAGLSSRSSGSSMASSASLPKLEPARLMKVTTGQMTKHSAEPGPRSSRECQTTPQICSLSPIVVDEESGPFNVDDARIQSINLELRQLLLSPYSQFTLCFPHICS